MIDAAPDHRKMKRLARRLDIWHVTAVGIMECFWNAVNRYHPNGDIAAANPEAIAEWCKVDLIHHIEPGDLVAALVEVGFLDRSGSMLLVHDWAEHCYMYTHHKLARKFQYFADGSEPKLAGFWDRKTAKSQVEEFYRSERAARTHKADPRTHKAEKGAHKAVARTHSADEAAENPADSAPNDAARTHKAEKGAHKAVVGRRHVPTEPKKAPTATPPKPTPKPTSHENNVKLEAVKRDCEIRNAAAAAAHSSNGESAGFAWPLAAAAVQERFERTEDALVSDLAELALMTLRECGGDSERLTDEALAGALAAAHFPKQTSAKGFFKTLPPVIRNWAKPKRTK